MSSVAKHRSLSREARSRSASTKGKRTFEPVCPKVVLSRLVLSSIYISLVLIILSSLAWLVMLIWVVVQCANKLYGPSYYWTCSAYCVLVAVRALLGVVSLHRVGPSKLSHLALVLLLVCLVECLIVSRVLFSLAEIDHYTEYKWQILPTCVLSLTRLGCSLAAYLLLQRALSNVAWDVGDPIE